MPAAPARHLTLIPVLLIALSVVALAWPRLWAELTYLPVQTALNRAAEGQAIGTDQLAPLIRRAGDALARHGHYRYRDGLSALHYRAGGVESAGAEERRQHLAMAADHAQQALAQAPMQPALWLRLASARDSLKAAPEAVVPALLMSVYTGRVEPTLLPLRLELLLRHRRHLGEEGARLLRDQLLLTWRLQPRALLAGIRQGAMPYHAVAAVLATRDAATLAQIDEALHALVR